MKSEILLLKCTCYNHRQIQARKNVKNEINSRLNKLNNLLKNSADKNLGCK